MPDEVVVEKSLGKYRLPDNAVDLDRWLVDGLEVYNLFVLMKPVFFEMLAALGGEFKVSAREANEDPHARRLQIREEDVGRSGEEGWDRVIVATLVQGDPRDPGEREMRSLLLDILCRSEVLAAMPEEMRKRVERAVSPGREAADASQGSSGV